MNIHVVEEEWSYSCGEPGCCDDYGRSLTVYRDREELLHSKYGEVTAEALVDLLQKLGFICIHSCIEENWELESDI